MLFSLPFQLRPYRLASPPPSVQLRIKNTDFRYCAWGTRSVPFPVMDSLTVHRSLPPKKMLVASVREV